MVPPGLIRYHGSRRVVRLVTDFGAPTSYLHGLMGPSLAVALVLLLGCAPLSPEDGEDTSRCPAPAGEFPPTGCARIAGTVIGSVGEVLRYYVSVDTRDSTTATWFVAAPVPVRADGVFALLAAQVDPLGRRVPPRDSVAVDLLVHDGQEAARGRLTPIVAHRIIARFAAMGAAVATTRVEVRLPAPQ